MMKAAVIGNPIKHSRSPLIHNHWLKKLGIDGSYEAIHAENEKDFIKTVKQLKENGYSGFNITIPFKKIASEIVDKTIKNDLSFYNKEAPAINTIKIENNKLVGYNTDYYGFSSLLYKKIESLEKIKNIIILGAGGAAKSIAYGLSESFRNREKDEKRNLVILNRSLSKAEELSFALKNSESPLKISYASLDKFEENIETCDLLINSTSLGMEGTDKNLTLNLNNSKKELFVYDIVYSPLETNLLSSARKLDLNFTNGLGMLVNQAAPAFCLFYNYSNLENLLEDKPLYEKLEDNIGV